MPLEGESEPRLLQETHGQVPVSSPYKPGQVWQRFLKVWQMLCAHLVEKRPFVQSLLLLLPLFNYLHIALTYGVCALYTFPLRQKPKPQKNSTLNKTTTLMAISQVLN